MYKIHHRKGCGRKDNTGGGKSQKSSDEGQSLSVPSVFHWKFNVIKDHKRNLLHLKKKNISWKGNTTELDDYWIFFFFFLRKGDWVMGSHRKIFYQACVLKTFFDVLFLFYFCSYSEACQTSQFSFSPGSLLHFSHTFWNNDFGESWFVWVLTLALTSFVTLGKLTNLVWHVFPLP